MGIFISCSQNTPELSTTDYSIVFDYENEEALPTARLTIFASSASKGITLVGSEGPVPTSVCCFGA